MPAADTSQTSGTNCHPSYSPQCLDPNAEDYDCKGGGGDGPKFVEGPVQVDGPDEYELDRDGNGTGCEEGESGSTSTGTVPRGGVATGFGGASTESPHDDEADGRFVLGVAGLSLLLVGLAVGGRALARNP